MSDEYIRCEGFTRNGGIMTFGPVEWNQCENDAQVMITAVQGNEKGTYPMCLECWQRGIDYNIEISEVVPITREEKMSDEQNAILKLEQENEKMKKALIEISEWQYTETISLPDNIRGVLKTLGDIAREGLGKDAQDE